MGSAQLGRLRPLLEVPEIAVRRVNFDWSESSEVQEA
jgi:hypothetical protein